MEPIKTHIYIDETGNDGSELWYSYSPGSGHISKIKKTYSNGKNEFFDSIVDKILDWGKKEKPIKKQKTMEMYEVPVYPKSNDKKRFSIWDGDICPITSAYIVIENSGSNINKSFIHLFYTNKKTKDKNEALSWMKNFV